jgi:protein SCO1
MKKSFFISAIIIVMTIMTACQDKLPVEGKIKHFTLTDANGATYDSQSGKAKILTFFYTNCPDICPLTLHDLRTVQKELIQKDLLPQEVEIIAITLDPETDDVTLLSEYQNIFKPHKEGWKFLTGSTEQIANITKDLKFFYQISESTGLATHATTMYILDKDNNIRAYHRMHSVDGEKVNISDIVADVEQLVD